MLGPLMLALSVAAMTPQQKAALVVVSGLPAPAGVAGVIVRKWDRDAPRPRGALVFADQEGGTVQTFPGTPDTAASGYRTESTAFAGGRDTGRTLRRAGVHVDLAPVLDARDGPLGSRQFREQRFGVAFGRGLLAAGVGACAKHFPGLGTAPASTDEARAEGTVRVWEVRGFRTREFPCVMVSHAIYPTLGTRRASLERKTYALLRAQGFRGVAITDSLGVLGSPYAPYWARLAVRAGADLLLYTSGRDAARAIRALVPLAERGELDAHVERVLRFRRTFLRG